MYPFYCVSFKQNAEKPVIINKNQRKVMRKSSTSNFVIYTSHNTISRFEV